MGVKLITKYSSESFIEVTRLEFGKSLLNNFMNLKHWIATLVVK